MAEHTNFPVVDVKETGRRIQLLREARGISVREIQDYLGLDAPQAVYAWQRGESLPSVDHLIGLSKLFGVPVDEVIALRNE